MTKISLIIILSLFAIARYGQTKTYLSVGYTTEKTPTTVEVGIANNDSRAALTYLDRHYGFIGYKNILTIKKVVSVDLLAGGSISLYNHLQLQERTGVSLRIRLSNTLATQFNQEIHTYDNKAGVDLLSAVMVCYQFKH